MRNFYAIFNRELKSYFSSPIAYVVIGLFLLIAGSKVASSEEATDFQISEGAKAYTNLNFKNKPDNFQFAIIGDRTGGAMVLPH